MNRWIAFFILSFFVLFSFYPTVYELRKSKNLPSNRSFELVHNYITDYHFYLSRIREGWEGKWLVTERYTSEPHTGSLIQEAYLLLGHTVRHIPDSFFAVTASYHSARIVFGMLFFSLVFVFIRRLFFGNALWQALAFLIVITAGTWPKLVVLPDGQWLLGGYMAWWTVMDPNQRATFMPHITLGLSIVTFLFLSATESATRKKKENWIVLGLFTSFLACVFPPGYIFLAVALGISMTLELLFHFLKEKKKFLIFLQDLGVPIIIPFLISLPVMLYYQHLFTHVPWKRLLEFDVINPLHVNYWEYVKALGPTLPLGVVGCVVVLLKKDRRFFPMVAWGMAILFLFFVFQLIPSQNSLRFSEMATNVPLGILTAYLFFSLLRVLSSQKKFLAPLLATEQHEPQRFRWFFGCTKNFRQIFMLGKRSSNFFPLTAHFLIHSFRLCCYIIPFAVIVVGAGFWHSSYLWQKMFVDAKVSAGYPAIAMNNYIVYPTTSVMNAIRFLETNTPKNAIILAKLAVGNMVPAYTGRTVYVGHDNTVDKEKKDVLVSSFYQGYMTGEKAKEWLIKNNISYIFVGPQELEDMKGLDLAARYPYMQEVFRDGETIIYKVDMRQ